MSETGQPTIETLTRLNAQLLEALASRDLIGQAKGVIMERERIDAEAAFDILKRMSQHMNRKLRDIAQDVVDSVTASANRLPAQKPS